MRNKLVIVSDAGEFLGAPTTTARRMRRLRRFIVASLAQTSDRRTKSGVNAETAAHEVSRAMFGFRLLAGASVLFWTSWFGPARAQPSRQADVTPASQCAQAIQGTEQAMRLPEHLLAAIGQVESGRFDVQSGRVRPWPWTINVDGEGTFFDTKAQAIATVRSLQARGVVSIDVGCMQVNLMYHPKAFGSLDQAFDPMANARYAARFLDELYARTNDWTQAAALYHSATPQLGADYRRRVLAVWPQQNQVPAEPAHDRLAEAWAATLPGKSRPSPTSTFVIRHRTEDVPTVPLISAKGPEVRLALYRSVTVSNLARSRAAN